jgi:hypothetical protein
MPLAAGTIRELHVPSTTSSLNVLLSHSISLPTLPFLVALYPFRERSRHHSNQVNLSQQTCWSKTLFFHSIANFSVIARLQNGVCEHSKVHFPGSEFRLKRSTQRHSRRYSRQLSGSTTYALYALGQTRSVRCTCHCGRSLRTSGFGMISTTCCSRTSEDTIVFLASILSLFKTSRNSM